MDFNKLVGREDVDFNNNPPGAFLIGLMSVFENRYQAVADKGIERITWKQFFILICIDLCKESPTINQLSEVAGSSHQNVKQILNKLEKLGLVEVTIDEKDRRRQRVVITDECRKFYSEIEDNANKVMEKMFEGVSEQEILSTVQTLIKMERNLRGL